MKIFKKEKEGNKRKITLFGFLKISYKRNKGLKITNKGGGTQSMELTPKCIIPLEKAILFSTEAIIK